jgi:hypothetical protein
VSPGIVKRADTVQRGSRSLPPLSQQSVFDGFENRHQIAASMDDTLDSDCIQTNPKKYDVVTD